MNLKELWEIDKFFNRNGMSFEKLLESIEEQLETSESDSQTLTEDSLGWDDGDSIRDLLPTIKITEDWDKTKPFFSYPDVTEDRLMIYGESMDELVSNSEKFGLTHIMSTKEGNSFFSFVDELYENENKYPYLTKVFDAEKEDYEKLRIKVFRIDFDVFKSGK